MPSPDTDSAASTPRSSSGRRLINQLTSSFKTKSRTVNDFHVVVDDPHRQYSPGDTVQGSVRFQLLKPIRLTHLVVVLHGFVQVYKNPNSPPAEGYRANNVGSGRGIRSGEYFGNGFASLFEDEVVLCGDGRLGEGKYQFNFELLFPDVDLPSSISFERGTISYMITATITRPTTISPILQADHKVYLVERIDIATILPPKPRTITLEPISRRTRAKTQARKLLDAERKARKGDAKQESSARRSSQCSSSPSSHADGGDSVTSPAPSELSLDSVLSQSRNAASQRDSNATSPQPSEAGQTNTSKGSKLTRTITATVEQQIGGTLRGDAIPIRIHIEHTKYVKSLHGVIITLYRQARVDLHPAIPVGPTEKGKERKYEDYYPKSMTGLGGLSLSGAGSSHVFRKDLAQTILPLIIDPTNLTADIAGKVQIPDEAFPTISTVPGAMISFRYYVEVVLDIQGKLGSSDRNLGNLGGLGTTMAPGGHTMDDQTRSANNPYGPSIIDTAGVRRDKGVVACTFEVIVGTKDSQRSQRRKEKRRVEVDPSLDSSGDQASPQRTQPQVGPDTQAGAQNEEYEHYDEQWHGPGYGYDLSPYAQQGYQLHNGYMDYQGQYAYEQPVYYPTQPAVPMPSIEDESQLPEKERMRRAEERLLPSQPDEQDGPSGSSSHTPTAPYLPEEELNGHVSVPSDPLPTYLAPPSVAAGCGRDMLAFGSVDFARNVPLPMTPDYEPRNEFFAPSATTTPSAPAYERSEPGASRAPAIPGATRSTDDKVELRRRQLEQEASAPPEEDDDGMEATQTPTAPALDEHDGPYTDIDDSHAEASGSADLPRYER